MEEFSQLSSSMQAHEIEPSSYSTSTIIGRPIRKAATTTMAKYEPFDESNKIPRKRAKSTTLGLPKIKQNNDNITILTADGIPLKRPRGRPPLLCKKSIDILPIGGSINYSTSNNYVYSSMSSNTPIYVPDNVSVISNEVINVKEKEKEIDNKDKDKDEKTLKISPLQVTQRILNRLMTENPLEMSEISKGLPDVPKDLIQSVLDTAQILGIVITVKLNNDESYSENIDNNEIKINTSNNETNINDETKQNDDNSFKVDFEDNNDNNNGDININNNNNGDMNSNSNSNSNSNNEIASDFNNIQLARKESDDTKKKKRRESDGKKLKRSKIGILPGNTNDTVYYTISGFGKSSESVEFKNIIQSTELKITKTKEIRERMKLLEELSLTEMSSKDR